MHFKHARATAPHDGAAHMDPAQATIIWTECLHGTASLRDGLAALSGVTGAASALLYRWCPVSRRPRIIASRQRDPARGAQPLPHPVGPDLIPVELHRARPGSVWRLEDAGSDLDSRQAQSVAERGLVDIVVIPLGQTDGTVDVLELCLDRSAAPALVTMLRDLARALSFAWSRRPHGRISQILSNTPLTDRRLRGAQNTTPLSVGNPWRLTPTEMRICHLIREGQDPARIVSLIGVTESTMRTHLRSIYAKSGVTGQVGLVRLLLADAPARQA